MIMRVSVRRFLARYPEFKSVNQKHPARVLICLEDAHAEVSARIWGNLYEQGVCALTAHKLEARGWSIPDSDGEAQPLQKVASESASGLSVSYVTGASSGSQNDEYFSTTSYGQEYIRLRRLTARHILVAR